MAQVRNALGEQTPPTQLQYSWTDTAEGVGYLTYYGFVHRNDSGTEYGLSTTQLYSDKGEATFETRAVAAPASFTELFNQDFDSPTFKNGQVVRGTCWAQVNWETAPDVSDDVISSKATITIKHVDSTGTETTIGSETSNTMTAAAGTTVQKIALIKIPLTTTHFGKDEILRINVTIEWKKDSGSGTNLEIATAYDPQNRDGTYITPSSTDIISQYLFHMPFRLELG